MKISLLSLLFIFILFSSLLSAQNEQPFYLKDRGTGIPTSMFGTFIKDSEFIIYPFYEYYYDQDAEYKPSELGYSLDSDFRGRFKAHEGLIFLAYGFTENLALEFEASVISAKLYKSDKDFSNTPSVIEESGLGDVESQIRYRWLKEELNSPGFFSYFETVFPLQKRKKIIGTQDWEFKLGSGFIKGFTWGTVTFRAAIEYDKSENKLDPGEYAIEYLRRISELFRFYIGVEGSQDEVELITDLQFHISENAFIRINNAFGITSKATDYAPEIGLLFHF